MAAELDASRMARDAFAQKFQSKTRRRTEDGIVEGLNLDGTYIVRVPGRPKPYPSCACIIPKVTLSIGQGCTIGFLYDNPDLAVIIAAKNVGRHKSVLPVLFGLWPCPEGHPRITYGNVSPQPLSNTWGADFLVEDLVRAPGPPTYDDRKDQADPTGLVRYDVGGTSYLLCYYWYSPAGLGIGTPALRLYNLTTGSWQTGVDQVGDGTRQVATWSRNLSERRQGYLFHLVDEEQLLDPVLAVVAHGNSLDNGRGGGFWLRRHKQLGTAKPSKFEAWTVNNVLDRSSTDPSTGKIYKPIERSGSISAADWCLLEGYWTGWCHDDNPDQAFADQAAGNRARLHHYRIDPSNLSVARGSVDLVPKLQAALAAPIWEVLACGIMDTNEVKYGASTVAGGSQLQILSTRWPFCKATRSFWLTIPCTIKDGFVPVPRIATASLKTRSGKLEILTTRGPADETLQIPYPGFVEEQLAALQAALPTFDYGGDYNGAFRYSSVPVYVYNADTESCEPVLDIHGNPTYWQYPYLYAVDVDNVTERPEHVWVGLDYAQAAAVAAEPTRGKMIPLPLPPDVIAGPLGGAEDSQGVNYGLAPGGCFDQADNHFAVELHPKRLLTSVAQVQDNDWTGEIPANGAIEEIGSFPDAESLDITDPNYIPCFQGIFDVPVKVHDLAIQKGVYGTVETYYRTWLIRTTAAGVETKIDISCPITLTDTTPRKENYSLGLNVLACGCSGPTDSEILWILRQWPAGHLGTETEYADVEAVLAACELHIELRLAANPETLLDRRPIRPTEGGDWTPVLDYAPKMLLGTDSEGPWATIFSQWTASGDTLGEVRHATSRVRWVGFYTQGFEVEGPSVRPFLQPHTVEVPDSVLTDNRIYWIDDCRTLRAQQL